MKGPELQRARMKGTDYEPISIRLNRLLTPDEKVFLSLKYPTLSSVISDISAHKEKLSWWEKRVVSEISPTTTYSHHILEFHIELEIMGIIEVL